MFVFHHFIVFLDKSNTLQHQHLSSDFLKFNQHENGGKGGHFSKHSDAQKNSGNAPLGAN